MVGKNKRKELRDKLTNYIDVLLIDEQSMLGKPFLVSLNELLQDVMKNKKVFGGIKLILLGDNWQLSGFNIPLQSIQDDEECIENESDQSDDENDSKIEKIIDKDFEQQLYREYKDAKQNKLENELYENLTNTQKSMFDEQESKKSQKIKEEKNKERAKNAKRKIIEQDYLEINEHINKNIFEL